MATWRPVGSITPIVDNWLLFEKEATSICFKLNCAPVPENTPSYLWLREWRNGEPGPKKLIYPRLQQTFNLGEPGPRLIEIFKAYPHWARGLKEESYQVGLEEWIDDEAPQAPAPRPYQGFH